jgi:hypothetical protein
MEDSIAGPAGTSAVGEPDDPVRDILPPAGQEMTLCPYSALLGIDPWLCMSRPSL